MASLALSGGIGSLHPLPAASQPPQQYRWVSPPPAFDHNNQPPTAGETLVPLTSGRSDPATASTDDGQVSVTFNVGAFTGPPNETSVRIRIMPVNPQPISPAHIVVDGNAYVIEATYLPSVSGPAVLQLPILLDLRYASRPPDAIYRIEGKAWTPIGGTVRKVVLIVETQSSQLGVFAPAHRLADGTSPSSLNGIPFFFGGLAMLAVLILAVVRGPAIRRRLRRALRRRESGDWIG